MKLAKDKKVIISISSIVILLAVSVIGIISRGIQTTTGITTDLENAKDASVVQSNSTLTETSAEWAKSIGSSNDYIQSVAATEDGGYLVGGYFKSASIDLGNGVTISNTTGNNNGMLIKYNSAGIAQWAKSIGGSGNDYIQSVAATKDGGYIVGGYFYSTSIDLENGVSITNNGRSNGMLIKYNSAGIAQWAKTIGGGSYDSIQSVAATEDGGYLVGGNFNSASIDLGNGVTISNTTGNNNGMLIKYNSAGIAQWAKIIGGDKSGDSIASVIETSDGGYLVGGYFISDSIDLGNGIKIKNNSNTYQFDGMLIKYNSLGVAQWAKAIGGSANENIKSVIATSDGGYLVGGNFYSASIDLGNGVTISNTTGNNNGMLIKYNSAGIAQWAKVIGNSVVSIIHTTDGGYLVGGDFESASIDLGNGVTISRTTGYRNGMLIKFRDVVEPTVNIKCTNIDPNISTYTKLKSVTIGVTDIGGSGLSSSNSYQYYLSTSASAVAGGTWTNYTPGETFTIGEGKSGTYHMFVKTVADNIGNVSKAMPATTDGTIYHTYFGLYLDNTPPTAGTMTMKLNDSEGTTYTNDTWTNQNVYIEPVNGTDEHSGHKSTTYSVSGPITLENQTNPTTLTEEGTYTITVTTEDYIGLTATRSYTVKIDKTAPVLSEIRNSSGGNWTTQVTISWDITENESGISKVEYSLSYGKTWGPLGQEDWYGYTKSNQRNNTLQIRVTDKAGNISNIESTDFKIDRTAPTITANPTSGEYAKSRNVTITTADTGESGLDSSNSYQYYLSTSDTALAGGEWTNYTSGTEFTIGTGKTGTYYLFVKQVTDRAGNTSTAANSTLQEVNGITYHKFGPYKFDNNAPTAGTLTMKLGSSTGSEYTNDTWTKESVYISPVDGSSENSGHKSTTYSVSGPKTLINQTTPTLLTETGVYEITVTTTDNAENIATNSYTVKIDKTVPTAGTLTMKLGSSTGLAYTSDTWTNNDVYIEPVDGTDEHSGHKTTIYNISGAKTLNNQTMGTTLTETGIYEITVTTTDNMGNKATNSYTVKIDKENPTCRNTNNETRK